MLICKESALLEAVHSFPDADINVAVRCNESIKVVLLANVGWEVFLLELHEFRRVRLGNDP
jgi:hypothetical protein